MLYQIDPANYLNMFKNIFPRLTNSLSNSLELPDRLATIGPRVLINLVQTAGYKKRQTQKISHRPTFDEYDKMPGDEYQTVYFGFYDDKRHTDMRAFERFYRLNWGGWIRAIGGRNQQIWNKSASRKWWFKQHVLCSERQSMMLEKMFEKKYRKKTYFVDDPYEIYENRDFEFLPYGSNPHSYSYVKSKDFYK